MELQGSFLAMSTAYHPQTDGQTEVLNRTLETYLRCFVANNPNEWQRWLPWAEYWYNTSEHSAIKMSPYEALYGVPPVTPLTYVPDTTLVAVVDQELRSHQQIMDHLKLSLHKARNRMMQQANKHRSDREFQVDDWVYLKLQPYRQQSVVFRANAKFSPKFYGPCRILKKVGKVAYQLKLPPTSKIHPTFHVSQLKKHIGTTIPMTTDPPPIMDVSTIYDLPEKILQRRIRKRFNHAVVEGLIKWKDRGPDSATWEVLTDLKGRYPDFDLEDKVDV